MNLVHPVPLRYEIDPEDPRAPSQELWDRLSEVERKGIVQSLPTAEGMPGEGSQHTEDKFQAWETLRRHFDRIRRRVYVASELMVFYPGQPWFVPDVLAVADAETRPRSRWVVSQEGRGIDFVLEFLSESNRDKDLRRNVEWFPSLGIPEYFVFDRRTPSIHAWRLSHAGATTYERVIPQGAGYPSAILGLDLTVEGDRLRFRHGFASIPDSTELIVRLEATVSDLLTRRDEDEQLRRDAEAKLAAALAELERMRRGGRGRPLLGEQLLALRPEHLA